ncbi:lectin-like domain-containing protein [Lactococcus protaetiae]|uniref:Uncharacterized protein n=1 Tax=Lactococcus protaetiae TaxID=2592653 RepID=A0A514Z810_9LACT|nr:hypothetical protein [Lactococcus protaetiae]QDK70715.1 hypothetical protein FLP15_05560 [Lactococcus protaetiae]
MANLSNWTNFGVGGASPSWSSDGWLNLINDKGTQAGGSIFDYAADFSQNVTITGAFKIDISWLYDYAAGDSLGFVLAKTDAQGMTAGQTNAGLGVVGIPDAIFAGRDFFYNNDSKYNDPNVGVRTENLILPNISNMIAIRQVSADGSSLLSPPVSASSSVNGANWKNGTILSPRNTYTDYVQLKWVPTTTGRVDAKGNVSGRLTMTYGSGSDTNGNIMGQTGQVSYDCTVAQMLSIGLIGSTGGHYSKMYYSNSGAYLNSAKATQPLRVNYINSVTGGAGDTYYSTNDHNLY